MYLMPGDYALAGPRLDLAADTYQARHQSLLDPGTCEDEERTKRELRLRSNGSSRPSRDDMCRSDNETLGRTSHQVDMVRRNCARSIHTFGQFPGIHMKWGI